MIRWLILCSLLLAGCASNVTYDYDTSANFTGQDSFSFAPGSGQQASTLDERRIRGAIERALTARGLTRTNADADILVAYRVEDARRLESSGLSFGLGIGGSRGLFGISTAPPAREVKEGRLVVEIVDPEKNEVIWRAVSRRNLSPDMGPVERNRRIDEIVRDMFENYPPGTER